MICLLFWTLHILEMVLRRLARTAFNPEHPVGFFVCGTGFAVGIAASTAVVCGTLCALPSWCGYVAEKLSAPWPRNSDP